MNVVGVREKWDAGAATDSRKVPVPAHGGVEVEAAERLAGCQAAEATVVVVDQVDLVICQGGHLVAHRPLSHPGGPVGLDAVLCAVLCPVHLV